MLFADTRNFKTFPEHLKRFFAKHRHSNIDIIWCSQYWDDCDKKIRVLTQKFYLMEKSKIFPSITWVKPIIRAMGVSDKRMTDDYTIAAPIEWKLVYRPRYYDKFDSFDTEPLPPVELIPWGMSDTSGDNPPGDAVKLEKEQGELASPRHEYYNISWRGYLKS